MVIRQDDAFEGLLYFRRRQCQGKALIVLNLIELTFSQPLASVIGTSMIIIAILIGNHTNHLNSSEVISPSVSDWQDLKLGFKSYSGILHSNKSLPLPCPCLSRFYWPVFSLIFELQTFILVSKE